MATVKDIFVLFKQDLHGVYDDNEIESLTLLTVSEISRLSKANIKAFPEKELSAKQNEELENILQKLQTGEPIQYILGHAEFYGLPFKVNSSVLIPRPETEELVEWVIAEIKSQQSKVKIMDIGTGSGCIAVSLKKNLPNAQVSAIDISPEALKTAKQNAKLNEVEINFIHADILNIDKPEINHPKSDIIISNPPYVTQHDKTLMHTNVKDFEPHMALFVPENDPLIFYKAIANYAMTNLTPGGLLFLEINENLGQETVDLLTHKGFKNIELRKDMSERNRMIRANR